MFQRDSQLLGCGPIRMGHNWLIWIKLFFKISCQSIILAKFITTLPTSMYFVFTVIFVAAYFIGFGKYYLTCIIFSFSEMRSMWGLLKVAGHEPHQYICEVPLSQVPYIQVDNRDFEYGFDVIDPKKIPRGPHFIKEPKSEVFDISRGVPQSFVTLTYVLLLYTNVHQLISFPVLKRVYNCNLDVSLEVGLLQHTNGSKKDIRITFLCQPESTP